MDDARAVLRVHRPGYRTSGHIRSELQFVAALADGLRGTRIDVPRPIAARTGELTVELGRGPDRRHCDLLTWVDGRELRPTRGLGARLSYLLGEGAARLHDFAERFEPPPGFDVPRWDGETMFSTASPFRPGPMDEFLDSDAFALFQDVARRTRETFERLDSLPRAFGIIHKDYILLNCRFARRGGTWRLGILDFDDLGWGYFLYDLAPLLGNLADSPSTYARLRREFLAGYRSVRPLPRSLEAHLPVLIAARHAVVLTWLAAKHRRGETEPAIDGVPIERHIEYRVAEMRRFLASG